MRMSADASQPEYKWGRLHWSSDWRAICNLNSSPESRENDRLLLLVRSLNSNEKEHLV